MMITTATGVHGYLYPVSALYPTSDGKPIAENTCQFHWIMTIQGGLDVLFSERSDVFVAGNLLWYPVEGDPRTRRSPRALVVFGRPKGDRGAYLQWEEDGIAPQVVFEVLSPSNTRAEMARQQQFYERHGVEEYYSYDPDHGSLEGWLRQGEQLIAIMQMEGWVSPRLGVRFGLEQKELALYGPDGARFLSYLDLARQERLRAEAARAEAARAANEAARAERLAAQLRALGVDPEEA